MSFLSTVKNGNYQRVVHRCQQLIKKQGVYSTITMGAAGFYYMGKEDSVRCNACDLEVSGWTLDMKPFTIHAQRSPTCTFVRSMMPDEIITLHAMIHFPITTSALDADENPSKRRKIEIVQEIGQSNILTEVDKLKQIRKRTFSHWPHRTSPSTSQMIEAGFFNCNVGDRVMCLYCNIVCQQWTPHTDDPCEVHKTLSPRCPYVISKLTHHRMSSSHNSYSSQWNAQLNTTVCHKIYAEPKRRHASFDTSLNENLPSVDDLVRAGFFYTGTQAIVTCFYCNGSLQNWGVNDDPTVEHARWFPHCAYAKQLCGMELYRRIQETKRHREDYKNCWKLNTQSDTNSESVQPSGNDALSRIVDARLDLPISQSLLNQNFKLSVIRRCWEDQFLSKCDDFVSDSDLFVACMILQKQIEHINGKVENIIVPSIRLKKLRQREQIGPVPQDQPIHQELSNLCKLCLIEAKRLVCVPCGHFVACVPCGHKLRSCPICRQNIDAFVRIYI